MYFFICSGIQKIDFKYDKTTNAILAFPKKYYSIAKKQRLERRSSNMG